MRQEFGRIWLPDKKSGAGVFHPGPRRADDGGRDRHRQGDRRAPAGSCRRPKPAAVPRGDRRLITPSIRAGEHLHPCGLFTLRATVSPLAGACPLDLLQTLAQHDSLGSGSGWTAINRPEAILSR